MKLTTKCVQFTAAILLMLCINGHGFAAAAEQDKSTEKSPASAEQKAEVCKSDSLCTTLKQQVDEINMKIKFAEQWIPIGLAAFGILLAFIPLYQQRRAERSEERILVILKDAHQRANETEANASRVQAKLLESTQNTITLVNETLKISKDEAERAANTLHNVAKGESNNLDVEIKIFLNNLDATDVGSVTIASANRSIIKKFADRADKIENYNLLLDENRKIHLTPHCKFIEGVQSHIEQNFDEASARWSGVSVDTETDPSLKGISCYWLGYLNTNLGEFGSAEKYFNSGGTYFSDIEHISEYKRSEIETRFFNYPKYNSDPIGGSIITALSELREEVEKAAKGGGRAAHRQRQRVMLQQANVHYAFGVEGENAIYIAKARDIYSELTAISSSTTQTFSQLGWAQASLQLGEDIALAKELLNGTVRPAVHDEALERVEPRSRATRLAIEVYCCLEAGEPADKVRAGYLRDEIMRVLAGMDPRLTVFSPIVKRYLKMAQFKEEVRGLVA